VNCERTAGTLPMAYDLAIILNGLRGCMCDRRGILAETVRSMEAMIVFIWFN